MLDPICSIFKIFVHIYFFKKLTLFQVKNYSPVGYEGTMEREDMCLNIPYLSRLTLELQVRPGQPFG